MKQHEALLAFEDHEDLLAHHKTVLFEELRNMLMDFDVVNWTTPDGWGDSESHALTKQELRLDWMEDDSNISFSEYCDYRLDQIVEDVFA